MHRDLRIRWTQDALHAERKRASSSLPRVSEEGDRASLHATQNAAQMAPHGRPGWPLGTTHLVAPPSHTLTRMGSFVIERRKGMQAHESESSTWHAHAHTQPHAHAGVFVAVVYVGVSGVHVHGYSRRASE
jgi:hypothetical protein